MKNILDVFNNRLTEEENVNELKDIEIGASK